jgi:hypothetical protein
MPPFGYRPLLTLVVLPMTVGVVLFGFGLTAEFIATLRAQVEDLRRREGRAGRRPDVIEGRDVKSRRSLFAHVS